MLIFECMQWKAILKYFVSAKNAHGIHSPFVFEFYNKVLSVRRKKNDLVQKVRKLYALNSNEIEIHDLGAGSIHGNRRKISEIANTSSISDKYGDLLSRIVRFYKMKNVIEFGTNVGIGTAYLSLNADKTHTIEGE